jgi:hypothetical protein
MFADLEILNYVANVLMLAVAFGLAGTVALWLARPPRTVNPFISCGSNLNFHSGLTETLS